MKKFSVICADGHDFEGWFADKDSLEKQITMKLVECPFCGIPDVKKALSAPNLSTPKTQKRASESLSLPSPQDEAPSAAPVPAPPPPSVAGPQAMPSVTAMRMMLKQLHQTVQTEFKDVGTDFADTARKMHLGEAEPENIRGHCTDEERQELYDEGIEVGVLPDLPPEN